MTDYNLDCSDAFRILGNGLSISGVSNPALCALSSTRIAMIDVGNAELRTYDWDGTTWSMTGINSIYYCT